jgi:V/A-type H+-transporting ATPase subunit I
MFYPQAMSEIELVIPAKDLLAVTRVLADKGIVQLVDASYLSSKTSLETNSWQEKVADYTRLEHRILAVVQALKIEEGSLPSSIDQTSMVGIDIVLPLVEQIEQEVQKVGEQLANEQKRLEQLDSYRRQLEPVADIDFDVGALRNSRYIFSLLGTIPNVNIERLQTSLERIPCVLLTLKKENHNAIVWLAGMQSDADILDRAARSAYLQPLNLPAIHHGSPVEIIESLHTAIDRTNQDIKDQKAVMDRLREADQQKLQILLWRVRASRLLATAIERFGYLRYTYIIVGWAPTSALAALTQRLNLISSEILIETSPSRRSNASQNVPVALDNPKILRPFQQLVTTFAQPRYEEVDPTFLIALTFPLLFGVMFGDVGHGLLLTLLGGLLASRKIRKLRSLAGLGGLIMICGLTATLFGFLYGSVFGLETILPALWLRPMANIMQILMVTIGVGIGLLSVGFLINILNAWRSRDWGRFFFDHNGIAGLVLYWSLIGLVAAVLLKSFPVSLWVFIAPAIVASFAVMFSELLEHLITGQRPLIEGSLGTYAIQVFFEMFETLLSYLSNSLSYVRVGAFAVAHGGLSAVFFILANLTSPVHGAGYWIVIAIGTIFIIGFEGLIVGIQAMRLEYYELFSKFYTGGGARYEPFTNLLVVEK